MTRKEFEKMSFEDLYWYRPIEIGRSWEKKRLIGKLGGVKVSEKKYSPKKIVVYGRPLDGTYTVFESFECSIEGFEQAKKFVLK